MVDKRIEEITFSDLRCHYGTGRSIHISGTGRDKKFKYRHGVMTNLGDIEQKEWQELAKALIKRTGEQALFSSLYEWEVRKNNCGKTKDELEQHTLELHMGRFFDDPKWVDYVPFNAKYRPHVLACANLVWVQCECCQRPGKTTKEQIETAYGQPPTVCCPICGRFSAFEVVPNPIGEVNHNG